MFACSRMAAVHMYGGKILKDSRYRFFYNGIDAEKFKFTASSRKEMRKKYQIKEDERVIGFVGRFEAVKNIPFLIHVFYEISQSNPQRYHLLMVGDGTLQKEIRTLVKELNLQEKVIFVGAQADVVPFFHMMDVFVLTSKNEGFPIVTLEAQAAGCPCVCASSLPEEVNVCGNVEFVSLKESYAEWAETIERAAEKTGDRQVTVQKLKDKHYDLESIVEYISSFYQNC